MPHKKYTKPTTGHAQNLHKIQVPSSPDFLQDVDLANDRINLSARHNYKLKRANVGRVLFKMYMSVADTIETDGILDEETFKEALIEAIKKMPTNKKEE